MLMTKEVEIPLKRNSIIYIPLPKKVTGLAKSIRHIKQLGSLLFAKDYSSYDKMYKLAQTSYSSESGTHFWKQIATNGLENYEEKAFLDSTRNLSIETALVVGCGAGREVFGLEKMVQHVDGIDFSDHLIHAAQTMAILTKSRALFYKEFNDIDKKYDLIFVTNVLLNLIPGSRKRNEFLQNLKNLCHDDTQLIFFIDQEELNFRHRFFWISLLLRLRSWLTGSDWEKGDIVSAWLANRKDDSTPLYYHYFPNQESIQNLFFENGFKANKSWGIFWRAQISN